MTEATWVPAFPVSDLAPGGAKLFRHGGEQIAVFNLGGDALYAVDNRCPHEGYPLVQGYVRECLLTCAWHNFKFDLRDGSCVLGDEDVRTFRLRVREDMIEIDVSEPDPAVQIPKVEASLDGALIERRLGQASRDVTRLLQLGVSEEDLAFRAACFDATYAEFGTTHVLPVAFDVLTYTGRHAGPDAVLPLMQAFELAAETHVRRPARVCAAPADPGSDPVAAGAELRALVEAELTTEACALLRGALAKGWARAEVEPWLLELCADHFLDFGHALIYTVKACDFLDVVGWDRAGDVLPALLFKICLGTREDTLPPWNAFRARLGELEPAFAKILGDQADRAPRDWDRDRFLGYVLDGRDAEMFEALAASLRIGVPLRTLMDLLSIAAAERAGRFDIAHDKNVDVQDGWLFVTHVLTYANAVRRALERHASPRKLRHLFFLGHFINKTKVLDLPPEGRGLLAKIRIKETLHDSLAQIVDLVASKQTPEAVSVVLKYVARKRPIEKLRDTFLDLCLDDSVATRPLIVGHLIKTTVAAFEEFDALDGDKMQTHPLLALTRFFASPVVERFTARRAHEARNFVVAGKVPRVLS